MYSQAWNIGYQWNENGWRLVSFYTADLYLNTANLCLAGIQTLTVVTQLAVITKEMLFYKKTASDIHSFNYDNSLPSLQ
jgi:hypothetical protein